MMMWPFKQKTDREKFLEDAQPLMGELFGTPVDPTILISVAAFVNYLTNWLKPDRNEPFTDKALFALETASALRKDSKLYEFSKSFITIMAELQKSNRCLHDFLATHDDVDLIFNKIGNYLPIDERKEYADMIDKLGQIVVYFLNSNDITELSLSKAILDKQKTKDWFFQAPEKEEDGLFFKIKEPNQL
jgi:hypothetical protein